MMLYVILGAVLALAVLIGFIIGLIRGFLKVQTWAGEYVVSALLTIAVSKILNIAGVSVVVAGSVTIVVAALLLLGCMGLFKLIKSLIQKSIGRRKGGVVKVINRTFGAIALAIKAFIICMIALAPILIVLDFVQIKVFASTFVEIFESAFWYALKPVAFDLIVIGIIHLAIRRGFLHGISSSLWSLIVIAMIVGMGLISYHLVFRTETFANSAVALADIVQGWFKVEALKRFSHAIAQWILTAGMFVLLLILVLVASVFMSKAINRARLGTGFYLVDGIIGSVVAVAIAVAVMLFIGYLLSPLYGFDFMQPFDAYFESSMVAKYFYSNNLLIESGIPALIPLNEWLGSRSIK